MNWHWDHCPACGATGNVTIREMGGTGGGTVVRTFQDSCGACDGLGRIRIPNGWHLQGDRQGVVTISSATITVSTTDELGAEWLR